jgi:AraC family transcriptional regulator
MSSVDWRTGFYAKTTGCSQIAYKLFFTSVKLWIVFILAITLLMIWSELALAKHESDFPKPADKNTLKPEIRRIEKMTVAYVRDRRPTKGCGPAWDKLMAWAKKKKLIDKDTIYLGVSYDHPESTPPEKQRYDACITVPKGIKGEGDVLIKQVAGGNYLVFLHRGPYENLKNTYGHICRTWAPRAKHKIVYDTALEIYKTPSPKTPPEKLLTEISVQLAE